MNNTYPQTESRRIDIEKAAAVSIAVAVGDRIRCVRGKIWLTQEGDPRDHYLVGGVSFCVDHKGRAVLDAIDGPGVVRVEQRGAAGTRGLVPGMVRIDSLEPIVRAARAAQVEHVARAVSTAVHWLRGKVRTTPNVF